MQQERPSPRCWSPGSRQKRVSGDGMGQSMSRSRAEDLVRKARPLLLTEVRPSSPAPGLTPPFLKPEADPEVQTPPRVRGSIRRYPDISGSLGEIRRYPA